MTAAQESSLDDTEIPETPTVSTETPSDDAEAPPATEGQARRGGMAVIKCWTRRCLAKWRPILLVVLLIAATGLPAGVYYFQYRPDQLINDAAARQAIKAASDGAVAVLSYSPDNLNRDFANAKSHLTGEFLDHYGKFTEKIVTPMAQEKHIASHARVARAALSELRPDSAVVLVFVNQRTESTEKPEPVVTAGSVLVTLTKVNGSWLISKFDPLV